MQGSDLLTSSQAIILFEKAGLSEATFYRKVRDEKVIDKVLPEGRSRGALYPRHQVEEIIRKEGNASFLDSRPGSELAKETDWIQTHDLPYILALDLEMYGIENTVDISITHAWWKKNPYMCRIAYDKNDRRNIWGALTIMPMKEETIFRILRGEIEEHNITPDDICTYEEGHEYTGYIASATIRPEHKIHLRGLVRDVFDYWCKQYPKVKINKLYAYASSDTGWELVSHFYFAPRYDIGDNAFELDLSRRNPNRLVSDFQACLRNKTGKSVTK